MKTNKIINKMRSEEIIKKGGSYILLTENEIITNNCSEALVCSMFAAAMRMKLKNGDVDKENMKIVFDLVFADEKELHKKMFDLLLKKLSDK